MQHYTHIYTRHGSQVFAFDEYRTHVCRQTQAMFRISMGVEPTLFNRVYDHRMYFCHVSECDVLQVLEDSYVILDASGNDDPLSLLPHHQVPR
jgi:hypothetical protein